jgi:plasmid replication initiation protein
MPKKTNQIVKKSNTIARAKIKPKTESVWEERIIAFLLAKIRVEDEAFHEQVMSFEELNEGQAMSSSQYAEAKRAVENLWGKTFAMPLGWRGVEGYPIFQHLGIDDEGNIKAKLNPLLCEHYLKLREQFAERSLPEFRRLSGTYAQMLFRHLNSWKARGEVDISIKELHDFLSVPPSLRKDFSLMRARILEPAHREITEKTSLSYTWEPVRKGLRKVEAVHFTFGVKAIAPEARKAEASPATPKKKGRRGR